jgi:hypothetical protein
MDPPPSLIPLARANWLRSGSQGERTELASFGETCPTGSATISDHKASKLVLASFGEIAPLRPHWLL